MSLPPSPLLVHSQPPPYIFLPPSLNIKCCRFRASLGWRDATGVSWLCTELRFSHGRVPVGGGGGRLPTVQTLDSVAEFGGQMKMLQVMRERGDMSGGEGKSNPPVSEVVSDLCDVDVYIRPITRNVRFIKIDQIYLPRCGQQAVQLCL